MQTRDLVGLGKLEAQTLRVVVDNLDIGKLERQEALVTASEGLLGLNTNSLLHISSDGGSRGSLAAAKVPVACTTNGGSTSSEQKSVGAAGASGLGGISANRLNYELAKHRNRTKPGFK